MGWQFLSVLLGQGQHTFCKELMVSIFQCVVHSVSVAITHVCRCSVKVAKHNIQISGHVYALIKNYLQSHLSKLVQ